MDKPFPKFLYQCRSFEAEVNSVENLRQVFETMREKAPMRYTLNDFFGRVCQHRHGYNIFGTLAQHNGQHLDTWLDAHGVDYSLLYPNVEPITL